MAPPQIVKYVGHQRFVWGAYFELLIFNQLR